jgi:hypothetical protein
MHWKSKRKLQKETTKLYLTELKGDEKMAREIRLQLGKKEYVLINLKGDFPRKINYISLKNGGFNYTPGKGDQIIIYGRKKVIEILENSKSSRYINPDTVDKVITLLKEIENLTYT